MTEDPDSVNISAPLPPLLRFDDGSPVASPADWPRRRAEIFQDIIPLEYGGMPPVPEKGAVTSELLHESRVRAAVIGIDGVRYRTVLVTVEGGARPLAFRLSLAIPAAGAPCPAVVCGDGCWWSITDAMAADVLRRGMAFVRFDRCEVARDGQDLCPGRGIYKVYEGGFGALSAWAWTYHRVIDFLETVPEVDATRVAITGHSRGGKTVLLAAATDGRVALVAANNSGCAGSGCFRIQGAGCETLEAITRVFPYWFGADFPSYVGREPELSFDQHYLKALIAPRPLLTLEALGDLWANPRGSWATFCAARDLYRWLGAEDQTGILFREGPHSYAPGDWARFLDFACWKFFGAPRPASLDLRPAWAIAKN